MKESKNITGNHAKPVRPKAEASLPDASQAIRVLLADDHPVVRSGIRHMLERSAEIKVVGEAGDGRETLLLVEHLIPDLVVLDMELPDMNGVEVARQLKGARAELPILVLSAHDDPIYIQELFGLGVSGYMMKEEAPDAIVEAVKGVARGEDGWVSRRVIMQITTGLRDENKDFRGLTPREKEVLAAVVDGRTNQEIGFALGVSEKTVEKHIFAILQKLGVHTRVEAAVFAVREGWL